jgi:hypothetical protein
LIPFSSELSSHLLSINIIITTYKTITLPVVLHGCETLSDTTGRTQTERIREQGHEGNIWKWDEILVADKKGLISNFITYVEIKV